MTSDSLHSLSVLPGCTCGSLGYGSVYSLQGAGTQILQLGKHPTNRGTSPARPSSPMFLCTFTSFICVVQGSQQEEKNLPILQRPNKQLEAVPSCWKWENLYSLAVISNSFPCSPEKRAVDEGQTWGKLCGDFVGVRASTPHRLCTLCSSSGKPSWQTYPNYLQTSCHSGQVKRKCGGNWLDGLVKN